MRVAVDTETNGLDIQHGCKPFLVSTFDEQERTKVWEWPVNPFTRQPIIPESDLDKIARHLKGHDLVFHNAIFDLRAFAAIGLFLSFASPFTEPTLFSQGRMSPVHPPRIVQCGELHDTQLLSHAVYSPGANGSHGLKELAAHYLEHDNLDQEELRKATVSARLKGKKLGWRLGTTLKGKSSVATDYWMPAALWEAAHGEIASLDNDEFDIPVEWYNLCAEYAVQDVQRTLSLFFFLKALDEDGTLWRPST